MCLLIGGGSATFIDATATAAETSVEFTKAQAMRGEALYHEKCVVCHGDNLGGISKAAALTGPAFWEKWDQETARALYSKILSTMPASAPGTLDPKAVIDIVAYILAYNGLRPGGKETQNPDALNHVQLAKP